jgi:hypothetical protein
MKGFEVKIVSVPHRERLVAEIYYDSNHWVEISDEHEELIVQFYRHPNKRYWEFPLDEALEALERAKKRLKGMDNKGNPNKKKWEWPLS